jgi:hypothetical protein
MKNLGAFINEFVDGFQQSSRFVCKVTLPQALVLTGSMQKAQHWLGRGVICESTKLPDRAFAETEMTQYGFTEQFPFHTEFTSLSCVFNTPLNGSDNPVMRVFHAWQNLIQDVSKGYGDSPRDFTFSGTGPTDGYYGTVQIGVFDRQNHPTIAYEFERVYPKLVDSVDVSWGAPDQFTKLSVGFTFSVWRILTDLTDFFMNEPPSGLTTMPEESANFVIPGGLSVPDEPPPDITNVTEKATVVETAPLILAPAIRTV